MNGDNDARIAELEKKVAYLEGWIETFLTITDRGKEFKRIDAQLDHALTLGYDLKALCKRRFPDDEIFTRPIEIKQHPRPDIDEAEMDRLKRLAKLDAQVAEIEARKKS
jgi:uncharacterized coiled-coil protein SlyX